MNPYELLWPILTTALFIACPVGVFYLIREIWRSYIKLDRPHAALEREKGDQADDAGLYPDVWRARR